MRMSEVGAAVNAQKSLSTFFEGKLTNVSIGARKTPK